MIEVKLIYRRLSSRASYLGAQLKNDGSRRADEERRISPSGSRTTHLAARTKNNVSSARMKNAVSHRADPERRISPRGERRLSEYSSKKL